MSVTSFSGGAGAAGCKLLWSADYDDVASTVTLTATHTHFDGSAAPDPQVASITVQLNTGQPFTINLLTDGASFDGGAADILNSGPRVRSGVRLTVGAGRGKVITFTTQYQPPA